MCGPLGREGCFPNGQISTNIMKFRDRDTAREFMRQHFPDYGAADHDVAPLEDITFSVTYYRYYDGKSRVVFRGSYDEAVAAFYMCRGKHADDGKQVKVTLDVEQDPVAAQQRGHALEVLEEVA